MVKQPHSPSGLRHSFSQSESTVASLYRYCHWPKKIISPKFMLLPRDSLYPITGPCKVSKPGLFASIWEISEGSLQLQHPSTIMWGYYCHFFSWPVLRPLILHVCHPWEDFLRNLLYPNLQISSLFPPDLKLWWLVPASYWVESKREFSCLYTSRVPLKFKFQVPLVTLSSSNREIRR